jgi:hypothetical protein
VIGNEVTQQDEEGKEIMCASQHVTYDKVLFFWDDSDHRFGAERNE